MAKVSISFLGVAADGYKPANYRFQDGNVITSTFIAKALKEYYHIDKLILIGAYETIIKRLKIGFDLFEDFIDPIDNAKNS